MRQHQRAEHGLAFGAGPRPAVVEPGEQVGVGRRKRVPHLLDVGQLVAAHLRQRRLGETRRDADARRAADQLQQRPAPAHVEAVEEVADDGGDVVARGELQRRDDLGEARGGAAGPAVGPQQRDRLGRVADVVARQLVEHRIDLVGHQLAERTPQRQARKQAVGERRQREAAVGIGRLAEILDQQPELAVARRRRRQAVEQVGELLHPYSPSSSKPTSDSARALRPMRPS